MPLCPICTSIPLPSLLASANARHSRASFLDDTYGPEIIPDHAQPFQHYPTVSLIQKSAETCPLCAMIIDSLLQRTRVNWRPGRVVERFEDDASVEFIVSNYKEQWDITGKKAFRLLFRVGGGEWDGDFHMFSSLGARSDLAADLLPQRLPTYSGSPECFRKAKAWMSNCEHNHPDCRRVQEGKWPLPTRLLRVGNDTIYPSLYECKKGEKGRWAALSYCWGGESNFVLNTTTYPGLVAGQPLDTFPATIRDGIIAARGLGLKYIWIDALCIQQDSREDWQREAPTMSSIYTNAVVTIVDAAEGETGSGMFCERNGCGFGNYVESSCYLPWKTTPKAQSSWSFLGLLRWLNWMPMIKEKSIPDAIYITKTTRYGSTKKIWAGPGPGKSTWGSRGWTLQEELLSWRTLTFTNKEILWGCSSIQVSESGYPRFSVPDYERNYDTQPVQRVRPSLGHFPIVDPSYDLTNVATSVPGLRTLDTPDIYAAWYAMVENYSKRKLTKDTDKLMAIMGLAKEVQPYISDRYCAGLWEHDLIAGLLWSYDHEGWSSMVTIVNPITGEEEETFAEFMPNSDPRIPSWSWASISNEVHWEEKCEIWNCDGSSQYHRKISAKCIELAVVEKIEIESDLPGAYAEITRSELTIVAPSFSWTLADKEDMCNWSERCSDLLGRVEEDGEFKARHRPHRDQEFVIQVLAKFPEQDKEDLPSWKTSSTQWAMLVLESVHDKRDDDVKDITNEVLGRDVCVHQNEKTVELEPRAYRRVSMLHVTADGVGDAYWAELATWPMQRARII